MSDYTRSCSAGNPSGGAFWTGAAFFGSVPPGNCSDYNIGQQWSITGATSFEENDNGTALLKMTVANRCDPAKRMSITLGLSGRTFTAPAGSPELGASTNCVDGNTDTSDWYYYTQVSGTAIGQGDLAGLKIALKRAGPAFQLGTGANQFSEFSEGASGWLSPTILSQPTNGAAVQNLGHYDINTIITGGLIKSEPDGCLVLCAGESTTITATGFAGTAPYTYSWSNNAASASITVSPTSDATYTVTITDANGCTATQSAQVTVNPAPTADVTTTDVTCGTGTASATVTASGGTAPYIYEWSNGASTETISNVSAGTYTVTVTDANGCTASGSGTVTITIGPDATISSSSTCSGSDITFIAPSNPDGTSYTWDFGAFANPATAMGAGPHMVTYTLPANQLGNGSATVSLTATLNGCSADDDATITILDTPEGTLTKTDATCGDDNGTITVTFPANPSRTAVQYSLNGIDFISVAADAGSYTFDGVAAGTYTVTAKWDNQDCPVTIGTITINNLGGPTASASFTTDPDCFGANTGRVVIAGTTTGTAPFTYMISPQAGTVVNARDFRNLPAGTYTFTVTDANGCIAITSATLTDPTQLTASTDPDQMVCPGSTVILTAVASGGTPDYSYSWSLNAATTPSLNNVGPGTYSVTITDANGCIATASTTVSEFADQQTIISGPSEICANENTTFSVVPVRDGTTYEWTFNGPATPSTATGANPVVSYSTQGSYLIELTTVSSEGCSISTSTSILVRQAVSASAGSDQAICQGGNAVLDGSNSVGSSFNWTIVSGDPTSVDGSTSSETLSVSPLFNTTYRLTVRDATGICERVDDVQVIVDVNLNPVADAVVDRDFYCQGSSIILDGSQSTSPVSDLSATLNYLWYAGSTNNGDFIGLGETLEVTADTGISEYFLIVSTDANGTTCGDTSSVQVNIIICDASIGDLAFLDVDGDGIFIPGTDQGLAGVTVSLTDASGNSVTDADGNTVADQTTGADGAYLFTNLVPGDYIVTFTNPNAAQQATIENVNGSADDAENNDSDADPTTGSTDVITLSSGESETDIDAGYIETASIGDLAFLDVNGDGIFTPGTDHGLAGVVVSLTDASGNPVTDADGNTVADQTTGADGAYLFTNLVPGDYIVTFTNPNGAQQATIENVNGSADDEENNDSDIDATGSTGVITLSSGENETDIDAGYIETASIGDLAFLDVDGDGIFTPGTDQGLAGVTVSLTDASGNPVTDADGNTVADQTTGADGAYLFTNLVPGDYIVTFTNPNG
ncbi:MAG: SdrD B-like domain-containing protein, partial [Saprospiraceae bacterium]